MTAEDGGVYEKVVERYKRGRWRWRDDKRGEKKGRCLIKGEIELKTYPRIRSFNLLLTGG